MANASPEPCPTCPGGICPAINTTPPFPPQDPGDVVLAQQTLQKVLRDCPLKDGRREVVATALSNAIRQREPQVGIGAAYHAIDSFIRAGLLSAHAAILPSIGIYWPKGHPRESENSKATPRTKWYSYDDGPAPYNTFIVRAEPALWDWRQQRDVDGPLIGVVAAAKRSSGPDETRSTSGLPTIDVDTSLLQVRYGETVEHITDSAAIGLDALVKAKGEWVSWSGLGISKPSDTRNSLPEQLKSLIESAPGKGYRLKRLS